MKYGERSIGERDQNPTFHVPAVGRRQKLLQGFKETLTEPEINQFYLRLDDLNAGHICLTPD